MATTLPATALLALALTGLLFALVALAGAVLFGRTADDGRRWIPGALTLALAGYGVFWCAFAHPVFGHIAAWLVFAAALATLARRRREALALARGAAPVALGIALFVGAATALLLLYPGESLAQTAQHRFFPMPGDNDIPRLFAQIIDSGQPARVLGGDWLTSDRPPLQTGLALLAWPPLAACRIDFGTASTIAGIWFQALWFPAAWTLLRALGLPSRAALGVVALLGGTAFLVFDTVFTWPKLAAGAFATLAFVRWFLPDEKIEKTDPSPRPATVYALGAACAACGWLSHGGVMFSLIALVPLVAWDALAHRRVRAWLGAAAVFLLLALPWTLYQKYYAPPGNRLVKWHLAGVVPIDSRGVVTTLRDQYRSIGWRGAWAARMENLRMLGKEEWFAPLNPRADPFQRRIDDVAYPLRTIAAWILGFAGLPVWLWRSRRGRPAFRRAHCLVAGWLVGGLLVWLALMFSPDSLYTHQGTYVTQLLLLSLLAAWCWLAGRIFFLVVAAVQWIGFLSAWIAPARGWNVARAPLAAGVGLACGVALAIGGVWWLLREERQETQGA